MHCHICCVLEMQTGADLGMGKGNEGFIRQLSLPSSVWGNVVEVIAFYKQYLHVRLCQFVIKTYILPLVTVVDGDGGLFECGMFAVIIVLHLIIKLFILCYVRAGTTTFTTAFPDVATMTTFCDFISCHFLQHCCR